MLGFLWLFVIDCLGYVCPVILFFPLFSARSVSLSVYKECLEIGFFF